MRTSIAALLLLSVLAALSARPAQAALTQVNVRIEGRSTALFEGPILTEGHDVSSYKADGGNAAEDFAEHLCDGINPNDPENTTPGPTPTAASVDAMNTIGERNAMAGKWYVTYEDYFVMQWGNEAENAETGDKSWGTLVNNVFTLVGGCQYELRAGSEVLWVYNAFEARPILGLFASNEHYSSGTRPLVAEAQLDQPFEVEVASYDEHGEGQPPPTPERTSKDTKPYAGALVSPVATSEKGFETVQTKSPEVVTTDADGKASIIFTTPGWHRIMAGTPLDEKGEEAAIRSNRLDVCVPAPKETGCGALPVEDETRTPPRYQQKPAPEEPHTPANSTGPDTKPGNTGPAPTAKSPEAPRKARLLSASVTAARMILQLTGAGVATVRIARRVHHRHRYSWQEFKRITLTVSATGEITVKLPRLPAGRYRVTITVPSSTRTVKTLTVPGRQR